MIYRGETTTVEAKKLLRYTIEDQKLLGGYGYSSAYKYNVKRMTEENTIIKI